MADCAAETVTWSN